MYDYVWLCMSKYDYVWICVSMYDYLWLWITMYMCERERENNFKSFCNLFQGIENFDQFKLFQMFLIFSYFSTNLNFVYLCFPLLNWRIYTQILCLLYLYVMFHHYTWSLITLGTKMKKIDVDRDISPVFVPFIVLKTTDLNSCFNTKIGLKNDPPRAMVF